MFLTKEAAGSWSATRPGPRPARAARRWRTCVRRYAEAGGRYLVCPICFDARHLDKGDLLPNAELGGTVPMWEWIGDEAANTFSY